MTPRQKTLLHLAVIVSTALTHKAVHHQEASAFMEASSRHIPGLLHAGQDLSSRDVFTAAFPAASSGLPSSVGCEPFLCARLSPLPSCHSVCLTCLLNRSSGCAGRPGSPACPPPTALSPAERPWKPRGRGVVLGAQRLMVGYFGSLGLIELCI